MITMTNAKASLEKKYPNKIIKSGFQFKDDYIFYAVPKSYKGQHQYMDSQYAVNRNTGSTRVFNPMLSGDPAGYKEAAKNIVTYGE